MEAYTAQFKKKRDELKFRQAQSDIDGTAKCSPDAPVVQFNHGPRAQTTPYLTRLHKERYDAQLQACAGAAK